MGVLAWMHSASTQAQSRQCPDQGLAAPSGQQEPLQGTQTASAGCLRNDGAVAEGGLPAHSAACFIPLSEGTTWLFIIKADF